MSAWPAPPLLRELIERVKDAPELDALTCAHLTAMFLAPPESFVTTAPISGEIRVCVGLKAFTKGDDVWADWPAWRLRWAAGTLDAAFGLVERTLTGVNFLYARGRVRAAEPPYACQLLFGTREILGEAEHEDGPSVVVLALLNALLAQQEKTAQPSPVAQGHA